MKVLADIGNGECFSQMYLVMRYIYLFFGVKYEPSIRSYIPNEYNYKQDKYFLLASLFFARFTSFWSEQKQIFFQFRKFSGKIYIINCKVLLNCKLFTSNYVFYSTTQLKNEFSVPTHYSSRLYLLSVAFILDSKKKFSLCPILLFSCHLCLIPVDLLLSRVFPILHLFRISTFLFGQNLNGA